MKDLPDFLTIEDINDIHENQIALYGGGNGVRDKGLLQSALSIPMASFGGSFLHQDIFEMAAAYLYHIVQNHTFIDGNKRTGAASALTFLVLNGYKLKATQDDFEAMLLSVASSKMEKEMVADFIRKHALSI